VQGATEGQARDFAIRNRFPRRLNPNDIVLCCAIRALESCHWQIGHGNKDRVSTVRPKELDEEATLMSKHHSIKLTGYSRFDFGR
jgi:hypothetical protein